MKIKFIDFFRKKNDLQDIYSASGFEVLAKSINTYPFFLCLKSNNVYAYSSRFMVKPGDVDKVKKLKMKRYV